MAETALAFVSVGSNIEPQENILTALLCLHRTQPALTTSTFYRTEPIGPSDQPPYVNGVWCLDTVHSAIEVKELLADVERDCGRCRSADRFAPRTIDLDLILYNDLVVRNEHLILPHPDLQRPFVHAPVLELLAQLSTRLDDDLHRRIGRLLPSDPPTTNPGQELTEFTQRLRRVCSS